MRHIGIKAQIPIGHDYRQALFGGIAFNASTPHPGGMVVAAAMQQIQYRIAFGALASMPIWPAVVCGKRTFILILLPNTFEKKSTCRKAICPAPLFLLIYAIKRRSSRHRYAHHLLCRRNRAHAQHAALYRKLDLIARIGHAVNPHRVVLIRGTRILAQQLQ